MNGRDYAIRRRNRKIRWFVFTIAAYAAFGSMAGFVFGKVYSTSVKHAVDLIKKEYNKETIVYIDPTETDYQFVMLPESGSYAVEVKRDGGAR